MAQNDLNKFAVELFKVGGIKFGEFKTKVGLRTPIYLDLRVIISYPELMGTLSELIEEYIKKNIENVDVICGVPYTALPIATAVSLRTKIPMIMRRKEAKTYGTKNLIEGVFKAGDSCLVIEDIVTSGTSVLECTKDIKTEGLKCTDVIVLVNRQQGGEKILAENGIKMHALLSLTDLLSILRDEKCIDDDVVKTIKSYLAETQVSSDILKKPNKNRLNLTFENRLQFAKNPITTELLQIMIEKETTLCLAADLTDSTKLLNLAESVGPHICILKVHIDIVEDFHFNLIKCLNKIAKKHNFLLFEDRKFADIGKTVELQYSEGVYKISSWASLVTVHSVMGKGVLDAIKASEGLENRGVFVLAQASSEGNLINKDYIEATLNMASQYKDLVTGIVCQEPLFLENPGLLQLTPGVQLDSIGDNLGQRYNTPERVVLEKGADIAVVGRGITNAADPTEVAKKYQDLLWKAYIKRITT